jgi:hypothetical protein
VLHVPRDSVVIIEVRYVGYAPQVRVDPNLMVVALRQIAQLEVTYRTCRRHEGRR